MGLCVLLYAGFSVAFSPLCAAPPGTAPAVVLGTDYYGKSGLTLGNYSAFFAEPAYWLTFARTAVYSITVTFIILIIALPMAFYITKIVGLG